MYEINDKLREYFRITEPEARKAELSKLSTDEEVKSEYAFLETLFNRRHKNGKKVDTKIDKFLYSCVVFLSMSKGGRFFTKGLRKDANQQLVEMGVDLVSNEMEEALLYHEMRNVAARYFDTCKSPSYRRKLFGVMSSTDAEKAYQMLTDAWKMSVGVARQLKMEERMALWCKAVRDEYATVSENAAADFDSFFEK